MSKRYRPAAVLSDMYASKRRRLATAVVSRGTQYRSVPRFRSSFYGASRRSPTEKKVVDTGVATSNINTTGSVTLINGIGQGTDFTQRIGRRVNITAIQLRAFALPDVNSVAGAANCVRCMIVEDLQVNGVIATPAMILNAVTSTSFMNLNNRERFKVHYDDMFTFGPMSSLTTQSLSPSPGAKTYNVYKKVNIPMVFEGTDALISSISAGALYLVWVGNQGASVNDAVSEWSTRVRFIDA